MVSSGTSQVCEQYHGSGDFESACTQAGGTWSGSACPTTDEVGYCTITSQAGSTTVTIDMFYYAPETAADAETGCAAMGGTWNPA